MVRGYVSTELLTDEAAFDDRNAMNHKPMTTMNRRSFLAFSAGACASTLQSPGASALAKPRTRKRRLLFNWDGSMIHCWVRDALGNPKRPLTREQFTSLVFGPIENSAVDTLCFSFGSGNVAEYQSHVLEWPGQADKFSFPKSRTWHGGIKVDPADQYKNPKSLADAGNNPPAVIVEECRKRGLEAFVSLRMNDCHDGQHPRGTLPNPELATFKRQNPDWLVPDLDWWTALNYAVPRVRALKLKIIEEFFDRWDFDGIELDWLRHTLYFPRGTERENGKYLTQFMWAVRRSLQARAKRRGRPIEIAVRIPERVEWCLAGGFDVPTWIAEDLVDMLILGQGLTESPGLAPVRKLMTTRQLPIYPCISSYGNGDLISPDEVIRGSAANLWRDGADGLYTFNWFHYGDWRKQLLNEISDPELLAQKDKHYPVVQRVEPTPGEPGSDYVRYNTCSRDAPVPFELNVADGGKTILIPVADDPAANSKGLKHAELWIAAGYVKSGDRLQVSLNNHRLHTAEIDLADGLRSVGYKIAVPPGNGLLGFPMQQNLETTFQALRLNVPVGILTAGHNSLSIGLTKRGPGAEHPLRVTRVELLTRF